MIYKEFSKLAPELQHHITKAQQLLNKLVHKFSKDEMIIAIHIHPDTMKITNEQLGVPTYCHFKLIKFEDDTMQYYFDYLSNEN